MLRRAGNALVRAVVASSFLAASVAAFGSALVERRNDTAAAWASALERGEHVGTVALMNVLDGAGQSDCRSRSLKVALTVSLAALEASNPASDYEAWSQSLLVAGRAALRAVQCAPTDGNAWLRLAMVERAAAELPGRVRELVDLSARLAPQERDVVAARIAFHESLSVPTRTKLAEVLLRDAAAMAP